MIYILSLLHIIIITISNILVSIPLEIFNYKLSWAAFVYPLIVVITDLTVRVLGKDVASKTIYCAFPFAVLLSIFAVYLEHYNIFNALRIGLASACAYGIGTLIDVHIFQKIREKYDAWWIAPILSTIISNIIDTYSFFIVAFYNSTNLYMKLHWFEIASTLVFVKVIIGALFFLPIYGIILKRFLRI